MTRTVILWRVVILCRGVEPFFFTFLCVFGVCVCSLDEVHGMALGYHDYFHITTG